MITRLWTVSRIVTLLGALIPLSGCSIFDIWRDDPKTPAPLSNPSRQLTPVTDVHRDLVNLPAPKGRIVVAVYGFRDQTGQYKQAPDSSFSTAVTQGAASMLVKALADSRWFIPVEREGLQNVLTERRIVRALEPQGPKPGPVPNNLAGLLPSSVIMEGGIVAYETNVKTGGAGARYIGVGAHEQYRTDQVTVHLRAVDIQTGRILGSISTTKTVYSYAIDADVFRFVSFKNLLEVEAGYTRNEPAQLCVMSAIEAAVVHLVVMGIKDGNWALQDAKDYSSPLVQGYLAAQRAYLSKPEASRFAPQGTMN
jgi:curli production assembly/transport component CsgG